MTNGQPMERGPHGPKPDLEHDLAIAVSKALGSPARAYGQLLLPVIDVSREIIKRLRDAGISDITIHNALVREPDERKKLR